MKLFVSDSFEEADKVWRESTGGTAIFLKGRFLGKTLFPEESKELDKRIASATERAKRKASG